MNNATNSQVSRGREVEAAPSLGHREERGRGRSPREIRVVVHGRCNVGKAALEMLATEFLHWLGEQNRKSDAEH